MHLLVSKKDDFLVCWYASAPQKFSTMNVENEHADDHRRGNEHALSLDDVITTQPELGPSIPDGGFGWVVFIGTLFFQVSQLNFATGNFSTYDKSNMVVFLSSQITNLNHRDLFFRRWFHVWSSILEYSWHFPNWMAQRKTKIFFSGTTNSSTFPCSSRFQNAFSVRITRAPRSQQIIFFY